MEKNGRVDWKTFSLIIVIGSTILGVLWNAVEKANDKIDMVREDISDVRVDVAGVKKDISNLVRRIDGGEITLTKHDEQ